MDDEKLTIKAAGDFVLDVLAVPYGGQNNGRDSDGEFFTSQTDTMREQFGTVPVFHYHGMDANQNPVADPELIGVAKYDHTDARGDWYRVILDKATEIAKKLWDAARAGTARASSGAIAHLVRKSPSGEILKWPLAELSLMDAATGMLPANSYAVALPAAKLHYKSANLKLTIGENMDPVELEKMIIAILTKLGVEMEPAVVTPQGAETMSEKDLQAAVEAEIAKRAEAKSAEDARIAEAVKAEKARWEAEATANNRLPNQKAPAQAKFGDTWKYDNYTAGDLSFAAQVLMGKDKPVSSGMVKALTLKMSESKETSVRQALKSAGIKAGEIDSITDGTGFGSDWVGTAYGTELWEQARGAATVASKVPVGPDIPQGFSSTYIPVESTDPIFYKVPEADDSLYNTTTHLFNGALEPSVITTAVKQITVGKMGTRVPFSGELEEDSLISFAANARRQMALAAGEVMDYVVINGDTTDGNGTNINAVDTDPAGTEVYLLTNGFRKLCIDTNTANKRSAGGSLDITDFLETIKLMGPAGINAMDSSKVGFLVDMNTYWKSMQLPEVLTREINSQATVESGKLTRVFGYDLMAAAYMHGGVGYNSAKRMTTATGEIDQDTEANNLYGAILAVRWDQWQIRFKRRWTLETVRRPESDITEIIGMSRWGLGARDSEAAALTYYVGV